MLDKIKKIWADTTENGEPVESIATKMSFGQEVEKDQSTKSSNQEFVVVNLSEQLGIG